MSIKTDALIIGITGPVFSGGSEIAKILSTDPFFSEYNFKVYSLSSTLKKKYKEKFGEDPPTDNRTVLQDFGNNLRRTDKSILVKETLKEIEQAGVENNIIIDSIRNTHEVYELRKYSNFFLFAVNAAFDIRFERASEKHKDLPKRKFKLDDDRDSGIDEPDEGQKVQNCVDLSDFIIINNEDIKKRVDNYNDLLTHLKGFLKLVDKPGSRYPSALEIGMNYAYCASTMSRCIQRAVGAAITKPIKKNIREEQIIAIGCNNVPNGVKDCILMYGQCYRKMMKETYFDKLNKCPLCKKELGIPITHDDCGCTETMMKHHYYPYKNLDYCQALHAEENAILQALHSTSSILDDSILYTSTFPCLLCAKKIIQIGISKIFYAEPYPVKESLEILKNSLGEDNIIPFAGVKSLAFYRLFRH
jgi:deoxycytidylate deaminase